MRKEYSKSEKQLIEAVVGLFVLLPNPQLKDKKDEVMKIAYEVLENMIEESANNPKKEVEENDDNSDDGLDEMIEERISEIIDKALKL
jgi:hypothetical protein